MSNPIFKRALQTNSHDVEYIRNLGIEIPTKSEFPFLDVEIMDASEFTIIVPFILAEPISDGFAHHHYCFIVSKNHCCFVALDEGSDQFISIDENLINKNSNNGVSAFLMSALSINEQLRTKLYKVLVIDIQNMSQNTFNYEIIEEYDPRNQLKKYGRYRDIVDMTMQYFESINLGLEHMQVYFKDSIDNDTKYYTLDIQRKTVEIKKQYLGMNDKIAFLMNATLGFMSIEQNNISKVLTLVSSIWVIPTLVAGLFGMNFVNIPLMNTSYGFWLIVSILTIVAGISFFYMKHRGWAKLQ